MTVDVRPCASHDELARALDAIGHYFGFQNTVEDAERFANWIEVERMHAAWENGQIVGGAGAFTYDLSVPGGVVTVRFEDGVERRLMLEYAPLERVG